MKHARPDYQARIVDLANRIPTDEPVFLLRGQDPVAAEIVRAYAHALIDAGGDAYMVERCFDHAKLMDNWPTKKPVADMPAPGDQVFVYGRPGAVPEAEGLEPVFLLRGTSIGASETLRFYAERLKEAGCAPDLVRMVEDHADRMASYPDKRVPSASVAGKAPPSYPTVEEALKGIGAVQQAGGFWSHSAGWQWQDESPEEYLDRVGRILRGESTE